ncbi:hemerythrin domain-containing protein [Embleya sp. NBC_00896]|uniref:hemerythrin domain-containing protein n=1 Tax=Embleya sp. NBC_00896 TaxID=2975961 RepID=UPI00386F6F4A|nr:hemerythrin domain-containing protein [Embleya sp. NBC_00896]
MTASHTPTTPAAIDTHGMVVVHRGLRRESRLLAELIAAVEPGDTARAKVLAEHFALYRTGLDGHHHGEDELLWPPLLSRVDLEAEIVLRMEAQHERVAGSLAAAEAGVAAWAKAAGVAERDALVAALVEHRAALIEHLDDEEAELLPLAARLLTAEEWQKLGDHFVESTPDKPTLLMLLGVVLEEADADERATIFAGLPLQGRIAWRLLGRPMYARMIRRVRG